MFYMDMIMEEDQIRVINKHMKEIVEGVHMEEKLLSAFLEQDIFTISMVDSIRAGKTDSERLYLMMTLLMKRGPNAFQAFLDIVREDYNWLAVKLHKSYQAEIESKSKDPDKVISQEDEREIESEDKPTKNKITSALQNQPIKTLNHLLVPDTKPFNFTGTQSSLNHLYTKVKTRNDVCMYRRGNTEISMETPEPVSFKKLDSELDELFHRMDEMEHRLKQVNGILGMTSHSGDTITMLVELQRSKRDLDKQILQKNHQKNKYCDKINKLESSCRDQAVKIEMLEKEVERLNEALQLSTEEKERQDQEINDLRDTIAIMEAKLRLKVPSRNQPQRLPQSQEVKRLQEEVKKLKKENKKLKTAQDTVEMMHSNLEKVSTLVREKADGHVADRIQDQSVKSVGFAEPLVQPVTIKPKVKERPDSNEAQSIEKLDLTVENGMIKPSRRSKRSRDTSVTRQPAKEPGQEGSSTNNGQPSNKHKTRLVSRILSKKRH